jgi:DNA-binding winged helix-turn-helix (wHTH) protein
MEETKRVSLPIRFGIFEVDLHSGELRRQGYRVKLQDQPFQLLIMLLEHPGDVITREELQRQLWPADTFVDFERGLNRAINKLREALGDDADAPHFIETLPRRGYRFLAPVETAAPPEAENGWTEPAGLDPTRSFESTAQNRKRASDRCSSEDTGSALGCRSSLNARRGIWLLEAVAHPSNRPGPAFFAVGSRRWPGRVLPARDFARWHANRLRFERRFSHPAARPDKEYSTRRHRRRLLPVLLAQWPMGRLFRRPQSPEGRH